MGWLLHWLAVHTGTDAPGNKFYNFWSGFGSDLGEVVLIGAVISGWHHVNCHAKGCLRIGRHPVEGTPWKTCRKHHPTIPDKAVTVEEIHAAHRAAQERQPHQQEPEKEHT